MKKIRLAFRRWHCNTFDHPYNRVRDVEHDYTAEDPAKILIGILANCKYCDYCERKFEHPLFHPNCKSYHFYAPVSKKSAKIDGREIGR